MTEGKRVRSIRFTLMASAAAMLMAAPAMAQRVDLSARTSYSIPAQAAGDALNAFARQTGIRLLFPYDAVEGRRTRAINGTMSADAALRRLLADAGLRIASRENGVLTLVAAMASPGAGEVQAGGARADSESVSVGATPEILVVGRRTINTDIRRTEDDVQPYVVFENEEIRRSQAANLEDFFRSRLPQNTTTFTNAQFPGAATGNSSTVNLRGLGADQTLILINGRRTAGVSNGTTTSQPDLNGIPLASIERIEILPATASGIYGGGATGGVINIITRQDYRGVELQATYGRSFRNDAANADISLSGGTNIGSETSVSFALSYRRSDPLFVGDRAFIFEEGRNLYERNVGYANATTPPVGYTPNIRSSNGSTLVLDPEYGGGSLGSNRTFVPIGYQGVALDGVSGLIANAGQYNLDLPADIVGTELSMLPASTAYAASFSLRHTISRAFEAFADLSWSRNEAVAFVGNPPRTVTLPANAPNNPFTTPIIVAFPTPNYSGTSETEGTTWRAVGGLIARLPRNWVATAEVAWSRDERESTSDIFAFLSTINAALANGSLDVVRDLNAFPINTNPYRMPSPSDIVGPRANSLWDYSVRVAGPLLRLPGGDLTFTGLGEYREETLHASRIVQTNAAAVTTEQFARGDGSAFSHYMPRRDSRSSQIRTHYHSFPS